MSSNKAKNTDERIVQMKFNNEEFERKCSKTMSTLDKLKAALNFDKTTSELEKVNTSVKSLDFSPLSNGLESVHAKFSALDVVAGTVINRMTNSVIDAGKKLVNEFAVEPITTGFDEYELKMGSVQTIMASTGEKLSTVNGYLNELNKYSDDTIYSFSDMTNNIGKFTNAGVKLKDAVAAIKGISNEAALSGANAQEASRAMYNFSQALATGSVKLIDWKSIENANMATVGFKKELIKTAEELGTLVKKGDGWVSTTTNMQGKTSDVLTATKGFNDSLAHQWMTTDVLTKTLARYADKETAIGKKATQAATEIKTFSMMMDTLSEAVQSGWAETFELIFGDFNQGKALWTAIGNFFGDIIGKMSDARNMLIQLVTQNPIAKFAKNMKTLADTTTSAVNKIGDLSGVVNKVIKGDLGNGEKRIKNLTKLGYDWAAVQNAVNIRLGSSVRHKMKDTKATKEVTKATTAQIDELAKMNDKQLEKLGMTSREIALMRDLKLASKNTGKSMSQLVEESSKQMSGREMIIKSFSNIKKALSGFGKALQKAWQSVFPPKSLYERSTGILGIIKSFMDYTDRMRKSITKTVKHGKKTKTVVDENSDAFNKLVDILKGFVAILDFVRIIVGGPLALGFKLIKELLSGMDISILDLLASFGKMVSDFHDWIFQSNLLKDAISIITPYFKTLGEYVTKLYKNGKKLISEFFEEMTEEGIDLKPILKGVLDILVKIVDGVIKVAIPLLSLFLKIVKSIVNKVKDFANIGTYMAEGLEGGFVDGVKGVIDKIVNFFTSLIDTVKSILGIHSPSKVFMDIGMNLIQGLYNGIIDNYPMIKEVLVSLGHNIVDWFKNLTVKKIAAIGMGVGIGLLFKNILTAAKNFITPMQALSGMFSSIGYAFTKTANSLSKYLNSRVLTERSKAVKNFALAIAILAGSLYIVSKIDSNKLLTSVIAIGILAGIMVILTAAVGYMKAGGNITAKDVMAIGAMAGGLFLISKALVMLTKVDSKKLPAAIFTLTFIGGLMMAILKVTKGLVSFEGNISKVGSLLLKMSIAMLIMIGVVKLASSLKPSTVLRGIGTLALIELLFAGMILVSRMAGEFGSKAGSLLIKMSFAMLAMVGVIKLVSTLSPEDIDKGLKCIAKIELLFAGIILVTKIGGKYSARTGVMLLGMATAMAIMVGLIRLVSFMDKSDIDKGISCLSKLAVMFGGLVIVSKMAGQNATKAGLMLLAMSAAIVILAGIIFVIAQMDPRDLRVGLAVVSILEILFGGLLYVSAMAEDGRKAALSMLAVVGILALITAALTYLDPERLANSAKALGIVMASFATMMYATSKSSGANIGKDFYKQLLSLLAVVGVLAVILGAMSALNVEGSVRSALALGVLLNAMASTMVILTKTKELPKGTIKNMLALGAVVGELAIILGVMSTLNVETSVKTAVSLGLLLNAMASAMLILNLTTPNATAAVPTMLLMGVVVGELAGILGVMNKFGVEASIKSAISLSILLNAMAVCMGILAVVGAGAELAIVGALGMIVIISAIGAFMAGIGYLVDKEPKLKEFVEKGIPLLKLLGLGIGTFFGSIVKGFSATVVEALPKIGQALSDFMTNSMGFIDKVKTIKSEDMDGVKAMASALIYITGANLISKLTSFFGGKADLKEVGKKLVGFAESMNDFSDTIDVDPDKLKKAADAGLALVKMAAEAPNSGGWLGDIVGENDIDAFGKKLVTFGEQLSLFSARTYVDSETVEKAAAAGKALAEFANMAPNTGGLAGFFAGDNDIDDFGWRIKQFGFWMTEFSKATKIKKNVAEDTASAGKALAEFANMAPNTGGLAGFFAGDNDIDDFGWRIKQFGFWMTQFSEVTKIDENAVNAATRAGMMISGFVNTLPNTGGIAQAFTGDKNIDDFGELMVKYGEKVSSFSNKVTNIDTYSVTTAANAGKTIAEMIYKLPEDLTALDRFTTKLQPLGKGIADFSKELDSLNSNDLSKNIYAFEKFMTQIEKLGSKGVTNFIRAFTSGEKTSVKAATNLVSASITEIKKRKSSYYKAGKAKAESFAKGIKAGTPDVKAGTDALNLKTLEGLSGDEIKTKAKDAGKDISKYNIDGLVSGTDANLEKVKKAGEKIADTMDKSTKKKSKIKSPSRVFMQIGKYMVEGLSIGVDRNTGMVSESGERLADVAIGAMSNAITSIQDLINEGIDDTPTIRPVLDLSDVQNGARAINGLFDSTSNVSLFSNARSINSSFNGRNSVNNELIGAIKDLKDSMSDNGGNTYHINGITYDDGSNVSNAVESLVRAAKIERRI